MVPAKLWSPGPLHQVFKILRWLLEVIALSHSPLESIMEEHYRILMNNICFANLLTFFIHLDHLGNTYPIGDLCKMPRRDFKLKACRVYVCFAWLRNFLKI